MKASLAESENGNVADAAQDPSLKPRGWFATTHWSVVLEARQSGAGKAEQAMETLCRTYWLPLYAFVRSRGYNAHDAQDLVQAFFEQLLSRNVLSDADREKGKFRSFLLACVKHFLAKDYRYHSAQKRGGRHNPISLDEVQVEEVLRDELIDTSSPETVYDRQWIITVMDQAIVRLRRDAEIAGKTPLFEATKEFLMHEPREGQYASTAQTLQMTPGAIAVAVHRLRQRFRELVRDEVAHTVGDPADAAAEMLHLCRVLRDQPYVG